MQLAVEHEVSAVYASASACSGEFAVPLSRPQKFGRSRLSEAKVSDGCGAAVRTDAASVDKRLSEGEAASVLHRLSEHVEACTCELLPESVVTESISFDGSQHNPFTASTSYSWLHLHAPKTALPQVGHLTLHLPAQI